MDGVGVEGGTGSDYLLGYSIYRWFCVIYVMRVLESRVASGLIGLLKGCCIYNCSHQLLDPKLDKTGVLQFILDKHMQII